MIYDASNQKSIEVRPAVLMQKGTTLLNKKQPKFRSLSLLEFSIFFLLLLSPDGFVWIIVFGVLVLKSNFK